MEQVAAELFDLLNEDLGRAFPKLLRNEVSVHVIQSRGHILNTYDEALSKYAENKFAHDQVEVLTNSRVKEVRQDKILFTQKDENGESVVKELPMGFCLWSTGVCKFDLCSHTMMQFCPYGNEVLPLCRLYQVQCLNLCISLSQFLHNQRKHTTSL